MANENISTGIKENLVKLILAEEQNKICSKVEGRENYVIRLRDGKIIFSGTKGQYKERFGHVRIFLSEAYRYNTFYFTYKKDWLNALKVLEEINK